MPDKIRAGVVGAGNWSNQAHIPALKSLPEYELKAIGTTRQETADEAKAKYGFEQAFGDVNAMFASPDVDLVTVSVRVPYHYELTKAALNAGKPVYCEWPLGANTAEAEEMASLARAKGLTNLVGLQGRADPGNNYLRDLIADGYVGEVLSVSMTQFTGGGLERPLPRTWQGDKSKGAHTMSIMGGHSIDALCYVLGEFVEVSGKIATQIPQWHTTDTDEMIATNSPDNVLVSAVLESGALASVYVAAVPYNAGGWRLEIYGRDGTIVATSTGSGHYGAKVIYGAQKGADLAELTIPDKYTIVPEGTPQGPALNVGQMYTRLADVLQGKGEAQPDFDHAVKRHKLLDAIESASENGKTVRL